MKPSLAVSGGRVAIATCCLAAVVAGCGPRATPARTHGHWIAGADLPSFDADGPPDAVRAALERLLTRGLVEEDSAGVPRGVAADSILASPDSLTWTFRLRAGLRFTDGEPCVSDDFRHALADALNRPDHATRGWELAAVRGVRDVRASRPVPAIGIAAPDDRTVVLELAVRDPLLLRKLARPGVGRPWRRRGGASWRDAVGLGPYVVASQDSTRALSLRRVAQAGPPGPDTLSVRFLANVARVRASLREGRPDLVWPVPSGLLDEVVPSAYRLATAEARPARWMLLVMRADVPPTTRLAARQALVHGINQQDIQRGLGQRVEPISGFIPGAGGFDFPRLDPQEIDRWREIARLGRSFHVTLLYDSRGPEAVVARLLQGEWSRHAIYAEMDARSGSRLARDLLTGQAHAALAIHQDLIDDPAGAVAALVMPLRGPAVGDIRTGWRTREFDGWIDPSSRMARTDLPSVQARIEQERVVLPLARMPWSWLERAGGTNATPFHPRFGPSCPVPAGPPAQGR